MSLNTIAIGIIEHAIIPNAKAANIDITQLIDEIVKMNKHNIEITVSHDDMISCNDITIKRSRGRPKGAKNKKITDN
jgi:hypothetical protein